MDIDISRFDTPHFPGGHAPHSPAPHSPRHAALLVLAGIGSRLYKALPKRTQAPLKPQHPPLPGMPIAALANVFNRRF